MGVINADVLQIVKQPSIDCQQPGYKLILNMFMIVEF